MSWNRVREGGPRRLGRTLLPLPSQLPILGTEPSTGNNHVPPSDKVGQPLFQIQWGITACTERRRKDGQQPTQEQVLAHDGSRSLQGGRSFMVSNGDSGRDIVTLGKSDRAQLLESSQEEISDWTSRGLDSSHRVSTSLPTPAAEQLLYHWELTPQLGSSGSPMGLSVVSYAYTSAPGLLSFCPKLPSSPMAPIFWSIPSHSCSRGLLHLRQ